MNVGRRKSRTRESKRELPLLENIREAVGVAHNLSSLFEGASDSSELKGVDSKAMVLHGLRTALDDAQLLRDLVGNVLLPITAQPDYGNVSERHKKLLNDVERKLAELRTALGEYRKRPANEIDLDLAREEIAGHFKDLVKLSKIIESDLITAHTLEALERHGLIRALSRRFGKGFIDHLLEEDIPSELLARGIPEPEDPIVSEFLAYHAAKDAKAPSDAVRRYLEYYDRFARDPAVLLAAHLHPSLRKAIDPETARNMFSGVRVKLDHIDEARNFWIPELSKIILEDPRFVGALRYYSSLAGAGYPKSFALKVARFLHSLEEDESRKNAFISALRSLRGPDINKVSSVDPAVLWALHRKGIHPKDAHAFLELEKHGISVPEVVELASPENLSVAKVLAKSVAPVPAPIARKMLALRADPAHLQFLQKHLLSGSNVLKEHWPTILEAMRELRGKSISRFWENIDLLPRLGRDYIWLVKRSDADRIIPLVRRVVERGGDARAVMCAARDPRTLAAVDVLSKMGYPVEQSIVPLSPHVVQAITGHDVDELLSKAKTMAELKKYYDPNVDPSALAALLAEVEANMLAAAKDVDLGRVRRSDLAKVLREWYSSEGGKILRNMLYERKIPLPLATPDHAELLYPSIQQRLYLLRDVLSSFPKKVLRDGRREKVFETSKKRGNKSSNHVGVLTGALPILKRFSEPLFDGTISTVYDPRTGVLRLAFRKEDHRTTAAGRLPQISSYVRLYNALVPEEKRLPEFKAQNFGPEVRIYNPREFHRFLLQLAEMFPDHRDYLIRLANTVYSAIKPSESSR